MENTSGLEHPLAATLFHNLGGLEHARGRYAEGEPHARRSVEIRERLLGPDHPDTAADVAALAALLDGQGKYDEAEQLYRRALAVFERAYGPEHYEVAVNLNNLAALYHATRASGRGRAAVPARPRRQGETARDRTPRRGDDAEQPGGLLQVAAEVDEAARLYRRALAIFEAALPPTHPKLTTCRENYERLIGR